MHTKKYNTSDIAGFSLNSAREGEKVQLLMKGIFTSENSEFQNVVEGIHKLFIPNLISPEECNKFLIIRHYNKSADIYINDFPLIYCIRAKKNLVKGTPVYKKDIADITELNFPDITITEKDQVMFLIRVGWKFGIYFNFCANTGQVQQNKDLNLNELYRELGGLIRSLLFEKEYWILEHSGLFNKMFNDGWFPFIELLDNDYEDLATLYKDEWYDKINDWMLRFDTQRIRNISSNWWDHIIYNDKKEIIEAGITAYLENTSCGFINSIHNLYSQIEGILRLLFFKEKHKDPSFRDLIEFINNKALQNFSTPSSLGFPTYFYDYLKIIFKNFDLNSGDIDLSRHSVSHGVAKGSDYNKFKALQAILLLDQIRFYIK